MLHFFKSSGKAKFTKKEIHTSFNIFSFTHGAVFSPKEKSIKIFVSSEKIEGDTNLEDFIITIYDINNRCVRMSVKNSLEISNQQIFLSYFLDTKIYEPPYRLEIIHKKENENFKNFKFQVWYMELDRKQNRPNFFSRLGKKFPGPVKS